MTTIRLIKSEENLDKLWWPRFYALHNKMLNGVKRFPTAAVSSCNFVEVPKRLIQFAMVIFAWHDLDAGIKDLIQVRFLLAISFELVLTNVYSYNTQYPQCG